MTKIMHSKETIFLSGTDYVKDILNELYRFIKDMGWKPLYFHETDFPHLKSDAMSNCLEVAKTCDRMIVVIDQRAGLIYKPSGKTITEEEFNIAFDKNAHYLVYIRNNVWNNSRIYHRHKKDVTTIDGDKYKQMKLDGDQEVYEFIERLQHKHYNGEPRVPWIEPFDFSDVIMESVKFKWMQKRNGSLLNEEDNLANNDCSPNTCSEEEFTKLIESYNDQLPEEIKKNILRNIICYAWNLIYFNLFFALEISSNIRKNNNEISKIIMPICKACIQNSNITKEELLQFINTVSNNIEKSCEDSEKEYQRIICKMFIHILYNQPKLLDDNQINGNIIEMIDKYEKYWLDNIVDIYYRYCCGNVRLVENLLNKIKEIACKWIEEYKYKPLSKLKNMIELPIRFVEAYSFAEAINYLIKIAEESKTSFECKWCMGALFRILPLYRTLEDEIIGCEIIERVLNAITSDTRNKYKTIIFIQLNNMIQKSWQLKQLDVIEKYEREYIRLSHNLIPSQKTFLQMEYASCLSLFVQTMDNENINKMSIVNKIKSKRALLNDMLFNNPLLGPIQFGNITIKNNMRKNLVNWLNKYTKELFKVYAKKVIERNPLAVSTFKLSTKVYHNRKMFSEAVVISLLNHGEDDGYLDKAYYARAIETFNYVPSKYNKTIKAPYIVKAMEADTYSILQNRVYIGRILYQLYYYGEQENKDNISNIYDNYAKITKIGEAYQGIHWAYYAGCKYQEKSEEKRFIAELYDNREGIDENIYKLSYEYKFKSGIVFPDKYINIIKKYVDEGSLFASVMKSSLNSPEIWNIIATTIYDNIAKTDQSDYEMAAFYYSFAKAMARSLRENDQKYCYNYIRCKANSYKRNKRCPEKEYIDETIKYIKNYKATLFKYKEECLNEFYNIIIEYKQYIQDSLKTDIIESVNSIWWLENSEIAEKVRKELN